MFLPANTPVWPEARGFKLNNERCFLTPPYFSKMHFRVTSTPSARNR